MIGNLAMTFFRAGNGFLTETVVTDYFYGLAGVIPGTIAGAYVFRRIPGNILRYLVYAYIAVSGIIVFVTAS
ncbi:hypothetical protein, membrane [gut metagenome]|uniref:Membrane transporter protein n=1 Tax=gut metagenome TaxID=749906 RepID=J9FW83_9ZZZZ